MRFCPALCEAMRHVKWRFDFWTKLCKGCLTSKTNHAMLQTNFAMLWCLNICHVSHCKMCLFRVTHVKFRCFTCMHMFKLINDTSYAFRLWGGWVGKNPFRKSVFDFSRPTHVFPPQTRGNVIWYNAGSCDSYWFHIPMLGYMVNAYHQSPLLQNARVDSSPVRQKEQKGHHSSDSDLSVSCVMLSCPRRKPQRVVMY